VVGSFALKTPRSAQSWPVFVPKPEGDPVVNVGKHPARGALVLIGCRIACSLDRYGWMERRAS